jgi:serine/threonine protein kinase
MGDTDQIFTSENDFRNRYQYSQKDLLGEGGFAQVYKAYDKQFKEYVALKFFNKGEEGKYDVLHEMKDSRKFSHKNIIRIHDAFIVKFEHTFGHSLVQVGILEFADGGNLRDFIATTPAESKFLDVLTGILSALEYLHKDKKIIHRDLSPENILMFVEGDNWIPKIADFGISKKVDIISDAKDQQKSALLLGKVSYMAPEQFYPEKFGIHGSIYTNVDLWSFGVILYELFTNKKPFGIESQDNPLKTIQSITNDPLPDLNEIPEPYRSVIRKCLVKNANARVKSAAELVAILNKSPFATEHKPAATVLIKDFEQKNRKKIYIYSGIVVFLALFIAGYFILRNDNPSKPIPPVPQDTFEMQAQKILSFITDGKYYLAIDSIERLPLKIKSQQIFIDLRKQAHNSIQSFRVDSLLSLGNQTFEKANRALEANDTSLARTYYSMAKTYYSKVINDYNLADNKAQIKINDINKKIDTFKPKPKPPKPIPPKPSEIQYSFTVGKPPEYEGITISSIISNDFYTIISLELSPSATDTPFAVFWPKHEDAYFIKYNTRKGESALLRLDKDSEYEIGKVYSLNKKTFVRHIFDKLPAEINHFDLLQGKEKLNEAIQYFDFRDIRIKPKTQ